MEKCLSFLIMTMILILTGCSNNSHGISEAIWVYRDDYPIVFLQDIDAHTVGAKSVASYLLLEKGTGRLIDKNYLSSSGIGGAILHQQKLYYGSSDSYFRCYDLNQKKYSWEFKTLSENVGIPVFDNHRVYWGSNDSSVYAVDKVSGILCWKFKTNCHIQTSPVLNDSLLLIGSMDTYLYALHKETGRKIWQFAAQAGIDQIPLISGQLLWFANYDSYIYGLDMMTGEVKYQFKADNAFEFSGTHWDDILIFSGIDRYIYFVDPVSGRCSRKGSVPVAISTSPIVVSDWLFTGHYDGSLYRWELPAMTKTLLYRFDDRVLSLLSDGQYLWATSWDRKMACFDLAGERIRVPSDE
jgi:outer membrane protein assembly factor BamB